MAAVKRKTKSTKRARRKNPRADITRIVRDQIRVGASYPKMIQLLKQAGFSGKMLEEAKAIYQAEKAADIKVARREIGPAAGKKLTAKQVASLKQRQRAALPGVRLRNKGALKTAGKTVAKAAKTLYKGTGKVLTKLGKAMSNPARLTDQELVVLRAMNRIDRGGLVYIPKLIKALSYPSYKTKKIILGLAEKGILALHITDNHAMSIMPKDERKRLIAVVNKGYPNAYPFTKYIHYGGVAIRDGADLPAEAYGRSNPRKRSKRKNPSNIQSVVMQAINHFSQGDVGRRVYIEDVADYVREEGYSWPDIKQALMDLSRSGYITLMRLDWVPDITPRRAQYAIRQGGQDNHILYKQNPAKRPTKTKYSKKRNDGAAERREQFAGSMTGYKDLYFPEGTPGGLSTLGPLVLIKTAAGTIQPTNGAAYLCQDSNNRLYIGATKDAPLWAGPAESLGKVTRVEYTCKKPHLGEKQIVIWFHDFESPLPELRADGKGGLKFHGGGYTIKREGIVG